MCCVLYLINAIDTNTATHQTNKIGHAIANLLSSQFGIYLIETHVCQISICDAFIGEDQAPIVAANMASETDRER